MPRCACYGGSSEPTGSLLPRWDASPSSRRGQPVETGTAARTYPFSAGTLVLEGSVPFGVRGQHR